MPTLVGQGPEVYGPWVGCVETAGLNIWQPWVAILDICGENIDFHRTP